MEVRLRLLRHRRLFAEVWAGLPTVDRAQIEPEVALITDRLKDFTRRERRKSVYAMVVAGKRGCRVLLRSANLRDLDDALVKGVIAHELAHVLCHHLTEGVLWAEGRRAVQLWGEAEANAVAAGWGFQPPSAFVGLVAPEHAWLLLAG